VRPRRSSTPPLPGFEPDPLGARLPTVSPPLDDRLLQHSGHRSRAEPDDRAEASPAPFRVEVIRSTRRKRSIGARLVGDVLTVTVPSWMSRRQEVDEVDRMTARFRRKLSSERIDLTARTTTLSRRYDLPRPREIKWADDMTTRWGSCTIATGVVRVSTRLAPFPDWVIDYVIVHELAHLEQADHSPAFWRIVHRYPRTERAIGYLIAKSGDADPDE
jgi:Protein of unknown function DUF45